MLVVAAAIVDGDDLLACRRVAPVKLAGRYELPGGKVEAEEDPRLALIREIHEELDVRIECAIAPLGTWPLDEGAEIVVYRASLTGARPVGSSVHDDLVWLPKPRWLDGVPWIDVDRLVVRALLEN
jgi:8-oxo-dGTP diphosphatase